MRAALLQSALRGLSRKFWIVGAATVAVCSALMSTAPLPRVERSACVPLRSSAVTLLSLRVTGRAEAPAPRPPAPATVFAKLLSLPVALTTSRPPTRSTLAPR